MKYIPTSWSVPYYNMAFEQYLLTEMPADDYLFFYIHDPSIIVGKHQNTLEEINESYVKQQNIYVARRLSGGGAVYHDEGNLNYSFIMQAGEDDARNFEKFTRPIISALSSLGVKAELSGRNDLLIDGLKFSGNAQYMTNGRILHHGTLLFDSKMENLANALNVSDLKIKSKGIKSTKSRVTNIRRHLPKDMTLPEFRDYLLNHMIRGEDVATYALTDADAEWIEKAVENKFSTWEWNWGSSPAFEIQRKDRFPCGIIDVRLHIRDGAIDNCKIYGDFFVKSEIENLESILNGTKYSNEALSSLLKTLDVDAYFQGMDAETLTSFICP